jgi:hypothetical protein
MTTSAVLFMVATWLAVSSLTAWCMWRLLSKPNAD